MARVPLTTRFRTIRATMAATGLGFSAARERRASAFRRSAKGRAVLGREAKRREQARERRERGKRTIAGLHTRYAVKGLPEPSFARDYGPDTPYAVVLTLHLIAIDCETGEDLSETPVDHRVTETFSREPSARDMDERVAAYETALMDDRKSPPDEREYTKYLLNSDGCFRLAGYDINTYYVSLRRVA